MQKVKHKKYLSSEIYHSNYQRTVNKLSLNQLLANKNHANLSDSFSVYSTEWNHSKVDALYTAGTSSDMNKALCKSENSTHFKNNWESSSPTAHITSEKHNR